MIEHGPSGRILRLHGAQSKRGALQHRRVSRAGSREGPSYGLCECERMP
jgi:hypothetical protein